MALRFAVPSANDRLARPCHLCLMAALILISTLMSITSTGQTGPQRKTGSITGRVIGEDGRALEGAIVYCSPFEGTSDRTALTDDEGRFSFSGLSPTAYRVSASFPGYVSEAGLGSDRAVRIGDSVTLNLVRGGVITGRVTDATGNPVVGVPVNAQLIKDTNGKTARSPSAPRARQTDDRGIYRIYGLRAGTYLVVANPGEYRGGLATGYDLEIATYHPSSNRDAAAEVTVHQGTEATSIDIRYREERGFTVSGTVDAGAQTTSNEFSIMVRAYPALGPAPSNTAVGALVNGIRVFSINGLSDGDYEIVATGGSWVAPEGAAYGGPPKRVSVRGADVGGVKLTIAPGVSIAGKVSVETLTIRPENCPPVRESSLTEILVKSVRDERNAEAEQFEYLASRGSSPANDKSEFLIRNLKPGAYRLLPDLPNDWWYLKAVTMPAASAGRRIDLGRTPLLTRSGEKIANVAMTISDGAARLKGRLSAARLKRGVWRIHLVPMEIADADNTIIYYEALSSVDGGFAFASLAPGRYWISARPVAEDETSGTQLRPVAWDVGERTKLRREAEATKRVIDLKLCQQVKDFVLE